MNTDSDAMKWRTCIERTDDGVIIKSKSLDGSGAGAVIVAMPSVMADALVVNHKAAAAARESMAALAGVIADARIEAMTAKTAAREASEALRFIVNAIDAAGRTEELRLLRDAALKGLE